MCIRAGQQFKQKCGLFPYEKVKHYISVAVNFSINIESGPVLYFIA